MGKARFLTFLAILLSVVSTTYACNSSDQEKHPQTLLGERFAKWVEKSVVKILSPKAVALCFNIYDDGDDKWSIELVGTSSFDAADNDWACDEVFTNRKHPLVFKSKADWQEIQLQVKTMVEKYLEEGEYAEPMKSYQGIGVGFVDGDLFVVYQKNSKR